MSAILGKIEGIGNLVAAKGKDLIDGVFPPEQRAALLARLKQFAIRNPKLSAFLLTNIALTGPAFFLFVVFTFTVLVFALIVALLVALLAALGFTLFCVVTALVVLFPTIFFTTLVASFLFLWGLGGYYLLKWLNKGESPAPEGGAIGDKLNSLTGGRLGFIMGPAREEEARGEKARNPATSPEKTPAKKPNAANGTANGAPGGMTDVKKNMDFAKHGDTLKKNANVGAATKAANPDAVTEKAGVNGVAKQAQLDGVAKAASPDGVKSKLGTTTGTLKGTVGGATGLA